MAYVPKKGPKKYDLEKDIESKGKKKVVKKKVEKKKAPAKKERTWLDKLRSGVKKYFKDEKKKNNPHNKTSGGY